MTPKDPLTLSTDVAMAGYRLGQAARLFAAYDTFNQEAWLRLLAAKGDYDDALAAARQQGQKSP